MERAGCFQAGRASWRSFAPPVRRYRVRTLLRRPRPLLQLYPASSATCSWGQKPTERGISVYARFARISLCIGSSISYACHSGGRGMLFCVEAIGCMMGEGILQAIRMFLSACLGNITIWLIKSRKSMWSVTQAERAEDRSEEYIHPYIQFRGYPLQNVFSNIDTTSLR